MGGGLMQLVAYGAQDIYITGNPQITFFKVVYRRHTNFAMETIEHSFVGTVGFDRTISSNITRNGDLITQMYLRVIINSVTPLNSNFAWVRRLGHALIRQVDIDIGGTRVDRQYGTWLDVWYELARQGDHEPGYAAMVGDVPQMTNYDGNPKPEYILYIPLKFWFNKFVGLAIPIIALQYHEVYLHVTLEALERLIIRDCNFDINIISLGDVSVLVNYIFLDTEERRRFAIVGHEYLIEQIQWNGIERVLAPETRYRLDFNHPTKELIWATRNGLYSSNKAFVYYTNQDQWSVVDASCIIIEKSISIGINPEPNVGGTWIEVASNDIQTVGNLNINNQNANVVYVNPESLSIGDYGITNKITADVTINDDGTIDCKNVVTTLTIRDLSFPVERMTDTRFNQCDPIVNIFSNYGLLIDGSINPVTEVLLQFNGQDRFDRREGAYFNYVQPEQHHSNTPKDGVNCYSFALYPEDHQPSGTSNLSRIDDSDLTIVFADTSIRPTGSPDLGYFNEDNELYIYAINYNILRVYSGLSGLAYNA